jgi:predicted nucleotidyltransferase
VPAYVIPAVVDRLPPAYRDLLERAAQVLVADERVRGMWLGGSLARDTADAASDLDVFVAVADGHMQAYAAGWRDLLASITPTVLAEEQWFAKGSFWSITPGYERFDVVVEPVSKLPESLFPVRVVVFDHDDLTATLPAERPRGATPATVGKLVQDFFHFSAMGEVLLVREDWLLAAEHLHLMRDMLYKLDVEANQPLPPMGLKRWTDKLTPEQADVLRAVPTSAGSREELIAAHLQLARAFLGTARPLAATLGVAWPDELEAAARSHLREVFGVDDPYPA